MIPTFNGLVGEFNAFIDAHPRYRDMGDALELLMGADLTEDERDWLTAFCERWDVMMEASVAEQQAKREAEGLNDHAIPGLHGLFR